MSKSPSSPRNPPRRKPKRSDPWVALTRLLHYRPRTVHEARARLAKHGFDADAIDAVIARAEHAGLLDDRLFVKLWINDRVLHHPLARAAVAQELRQKGIPSDWIGPALDEHYPPVREVEAAGELAEARFERLRSIPADRRSRRTIDFLTRRGFSRGLAIETVRRLEREHDD